MIFRNQQRVCKLASPCLVVHGCFAPSVSTLLEARTPGLAGSVLTRDTNMMPSDYSCISTYTHIFVMKGSAIGDV